MEEFIGIVKEFVNLPPLLCTVIGSACAMVASAFGGFDVGLGMLLSMMALDYLTGMICAAVFHKSPKTENGGLESRAGWKGLVRKGMILLMVVVAQCTEIVSGISLVRDTVVVAYLVNELVSITENMHLMGVPVPKKLQKAIDVLRDKENENGD